MAKKDKNKKIENEEINETPEFTYLEDEENKTIENDVIENTITDNSILDNSVVNDTIKNNANSNSNNTFVNEFDNIVEY